MSFDQVGYNRSYRHRIRAYLDGKCHMVDVWKDLARKPWR